MKPSELEEYIRKCGLAQGESIRFDHENCPAGEDTKRRLYLTRPDDNPNQYLGYCHNCGEGTVYSAPGKPIRYRFGSADTIPGVDETDLKKNSFIIRAYELEADPSRIPEHGIDYINSFGMAWITTGCYWYSKRNAIAFPVTGGGYQLRSFNPRSPKYETIVPKDSLMYSDTSDTVSPFGITILTEDYLSAKKISLYTTYAGVANLGTACKPEAYVDSKLLNYAGRIGIWFDNDSDKIKQNAQTVAKVMRMIHKKDVFVIDNAADPKHYKPSEIDERLAKWI